MQKTESSVFYWLLLGCFLIFLMVIIGGITRLTHSGLSITEWNLIMGTFPPLTEQHWVELFDKYRQSPEFRELHYYFTLDDFKKIFWWEYAHRLLGRLIGIVFILPFLYFLIRKKISSELLPKLLVIFLLGALQGFLGWFMVNSGLGNEPRVSHYRLAAHLITAFATFGYTFWVAMEIKLQPRMQRESRIAGTSSADSFNYGEPANLRIKNFSYLLLSMVVLQIVFGAFVAGLRAGYLYPTFPKMGNEWFASEIGYAIEESGLLAFFENGAAVQFVHRWLATIILILCIGLWLYVRKKEFSFHLHIATRVLLITVSLQFLLGVFTLLHAVPVHLAVMHQAGAFFLFAGVLWLMKGVGRQWG